MILARTLPSCSLVPRSLPDFISQPWSCDIKSGDEAKSGFGCTTFYARLVTSVICASGSGLGTRLTYLSVDPVIRTDLLNFRQVTGPVMKENAPRLSSLQVCNLTYRIACIIHGGRHGCITAIQYWILATFDLCGIQR